jgi:hypothetical protein
VRAAPEHDVHLRWPNALQPFELLDVRAHLEHGAGLDVASELRVGNLVVPRPPDRCVLGPLCLDPEQEVGMAEPASVEEGRLVDDVGPGPHGGDRLLGLAPDVRCVLGLVIPLDAHHVPSAGLELGEVAQLVLLAPTADDIELGIRSIRTLDQAAQGSGFERRQVLTGEVADQIGRGEDGRAVDQLHVGKPTGASDSLAVPSGSGRRRCARLRRLRHPGDHQRPGAVGRH